MSFVFNPFTGNFDQKLNIATEVSGNIALNDGYISNDGGDEGIRITDAGLVGIGVSDPDTTLEIFSTTSPGQLKLSFDDDSYAAMRVVDTSNFSIATGETGNITLDAGGDITLDADGDIVLDANGKDITFKDNGTSYVEFLLGSSLTIRDDTDSNDYLKFTVSANGISTITTNDNDGTGGNLQLLPDGYLRLRPATYLWIDIITLTASGTTDSSLFIQETLNLGSGEAGGSDTHYGIRYTQAQTDIGGWNNVYLMHLFGGTEAKTFLVKADGKVGIGVDAPTTPLAVSGAITIKEQATAPNHVTAYGMLWVDDATPNALYFTNDDDDDIKLTEGSQAIGTISLPADRISEGDSAVSIGTDTGNIVFKNNSDAEWLTFHTSDIIDMTDGASMSEIFSPTGTKLRLRSPSGGDVEIMSGNNVDIAHRSIYGAGWNGNVVKKIRANQDFEIVASWNADPGLNDTTGTDPAHIQHTAATYANWGLNNDTTASYSDEDGFSWNSSAEAIQGGRIFPGLGCEAEADGITHDVNGIPTKVESVQSHTFFQIDSNPTATASSVAMRHWVGQYYYPTIYDGNLEAPWQADQSFQDLMQVTDQDATTIPAQLRGSTSGVKMVIRVSTGSSGIPQVYHFPSHGGSGYTNSFKDSTCDYNHDTGLNTDASSGDSNLEDRSTIIHNDDDGAIKLFMAVEGTGIPVGSYVGEVDVNHLWFRIHKGGGTGAVSTADNEGRVAVSTTATNGTLYFYDRVCFQDPGSTSEHMIVQVEDAGDGTINLGYASPTQALNGHMIPKVVFDFNEARNEMLFNERLRLVSGGVFQTDVNTVFLSGDKHSIIQGQDYTSIHAGDRFFMGALQCNNVSYFLDSRTTTKRLWLLASNVTNGNAFHATDNTPFEEAGGLEIATSPNTGTTNFQTRVEDGTTTKLADMDFTAHGDINLMAYHGLMTLNAREGSLTIETSNTAGSDIILDSIDNITLDSHTGNFVTKKAGTEFSVANSAFAGMILGYTTIGIDAADGSYAITNAFVVVSDDHKVKFVAPPSGAVEVEIFMYADASSGGRPLKLGLSDASATTGYSPIDFPSPNDVTNEHEVFTADETDEQYICHKWVVTGLTAGTSYEWWLGAACSHNFVYILRWGGNVTAEYAPFIMKTTALPTTTTDYSGNSAAVYG